MACGNKLIAPMLRDGQQLDASLIHKILKLKALYVRPSRQLEVCIKVLSVTSEFESNLIVHVL